MKAMRTDGYKMEDDPRFNGGHAEHNYTGYGKDPCDPKDARTWMAGPDPEWNLPGIQKLQNRKRKLGLT